MVKVALIMHAPGPRGADVGRAHSNVSGRIRERCAVHTTAAYAGRGGSSVSGGNRGICAVHTTRARAEQHEETDLGRARLPASGPNC